MSNRILSEPSAEHIYLGVPRTWHVYLSVAAEASMSYWIATELASNSTAVLLLVWFSVASLMFALSAWLFGSTISTEPASLQLRARRVGFLAGEVVIPIREISRISIEPRHDPELRIATNTGFVVVLGPWSLPRSTVRLRQLELLIARIEILRGTAAKQFWGLPADHPS